MRASYYRTQARQALKGNWKRMILLVALLQLIANGFVLSLAFSGVRLAETQVLQVSGVTMSMSIPNVMGMIYSALSILVSLLTCVMSIGFYQAIETLLNGGLPAVRQLFPMHLFGKSIGLLVLIALISLASMIPFIICFTLGWALESVPAAILCMPAVFIPFFVIPRLLMAEYILAREPEIRAGQAIRKSFALMKGNIWAFIGLAFSFVGWMLLQELVLNAGASILGLLPGGALAYWLLSIACSIPLQVYIRVSETAFFRSIADGSRAEWKAYRKEAQAQGEAFGGDLYDVYG